MGTKDPRVDAYIERSRDFAQPILKHLRQLVHRGCPEAEETIKWGFPHFDYRGIMCAMAAFKEHCAFGFWKRSLLTDPGKRLHKTGEDAMGHLGRITSLSDLPSDALLLRYITEAARLNEKGIKVKKAPRPAAPQRLVVPPPFRAALKRNKRALAAFTGMSRSHRKEYCEWVREAKTDATRELRIATAVAWIAHGKARNWKYERKAKA